MHFYGWVIGDDIDTNQLVVEAMAPWQSEIYESGDSDLWFTWDWYQIGGRYTGRMIIDYDPTTDPRNQAEPGDLLNMDGVKWPTQWASYDGDVQTIVSEQDIQWVLSLDDTAMPYCAFIHKAEMKPIVKWRYQNGEDVANANMRVEIEKVLRARINAGLSTKIVVVDYHD